jgi:DNA-directed RNA polymerase alpha subunit
VEFTAGYEDLSKDVYKKINVYAANSSKSKKAKLRVLTDNVIQPRPMVSSND